MSIIKLILLCSLPIFITSWTVNAKTLTTKYDWKGEAHFSFRTTMPVTVTSTSDDLTIKGLPVNAYIMKTDIKGFDLQHLNPLRKSVKKEIQEKGFKYLNDSSYVKTRIGRPEFNAYQIMYFYKPKFVQEKVIEHRYYFQCGPKKTIYYFRYSFDKADRFNRKTRVAFLRMLSGFHCR